MRKAILGLFIATVFLTPLLIVPLTIDYYHPSKELFSQLMIILCLGLWLIKEINQERIEIIRTRFYFVLLAFCGVLGISIIWAKSPYLAVRDYAQVLTFMAAFFVCVNIVRQKEARIVAFFAYLAGFIAALYALFQYQGMDFIRYQGIMFPDWRFRLYSSFGNPEFLADYLILIFPVGLAFYISAQKFSKKLFMLVSLAIIFTAILITFSIGAFIGLFLGLAFMVHLFVIEKIRLRNIVCQKTIVPHLPSSIIVLAFVLVALTGLFFVNNKLHSPSLLKQAKASKIWRHGFQNRVFVYRSAYRMVRDNPLTGVGIGNFKLRFPEYRGRLIKAQKKEFDSLTLDRERDKNVLNEYLQFWAESGIFALLIFFVIFLVVFKNGMFLYFDIFGYKKQLFALGILSGIIAFLAHSFLSFPMHVMPNGLLFWVFTGLLFAPHETRHLENRALFFLRGSALKKSVSRGGVVLAMVFLSVWPVKMFLSDVFLKRMVDLDKERKFDAALAEAKTSLFFNPHSGAVIYLGNYALLTKDYDAAAKAFKSALETDDAINFHVALAETYYKDNLRQDSIGEYNKVLLLNPYFSDARIRLAEIYTENRMYPEAEAQCQFILMQIGKDSKNSKKINDIMNKIFDERFLSEYYGNVQITK
ncbi:MAG: O-antigen ligase family protein [Candidatus Omnitrophica bacterium]|nr:O-antigen ligase family protein [Candidatus Omnitrophota bacterium]